MRALTIDVDQTDATALRLGEFPDPEPRPDQCLVAVHHIGVNFGELIPGVWPAGRIHGHDGAGVVVESAANGAGPAEGTHVVFGYTPGAWAERAAVDTQALAVLPPSASPVDAAALPIAGVTALRVMRSRSLLGRRVLITGASGGVGRFAVQLAALSGAHVTAVVSDLQRARDLADLGAHDVVSDLDTVTGSQDLILDTVAGPRLAHLWNLLGAGGELHAVGYASGEPTTFPPGALFDVIGAARSLRTTGLVDNHVGPELAALVDLLTAGRLSAEVGWRGDWEDINNAADALRRRRVRGKIVLDVASGGSPSA